MLKRAVRSVGRGPFAAVILLAAFCLPARMVEAADTVSEACRRLLAELAKTFSVRVERSNGQAQRHRRSSMIKGEDPVTAADVDRAVPILASELRLYPKDLIRVIKLKRIMLFKGDDTGLLGYTDFEFGTVYLNVSPSPTADTDLRITLHHELFHLLDYADDDMLYEDEQWSSHNPAGFEYGYAFAKDGTIRLNKAAQGFLNDYSQTNPAEDKAEIFSRMVVCAEEVDQRAEKDPFLKTKVRSMKFRLAIFCCEMDDRFWESAECLPRTDLVAAQARPE